MSRPCVIVTSADSTFRDRARDERLAMKDDERFSARVAADLDVAEREAAPPEPERLHRRFLGGEATGDVLGEGARVSALAADLARAEDARQESLAVTLEDARHPVDLRQVEPEKQARPPELIRSSPLRPKKRAILARRDAGASLSRAPSAPARVGPAVCRRRS